MRDETALLTDAERYLGKWQPRLHLSDWKIGVRIGDTTDSRYAEVETSWRYMTACITVSREYDQHVEKDAGALCRLRTDGDLLEQTILHELTHVSENPLADVMEKEVFAWIGSDGVASNNFRELWNGYREAWINRVSRILTEADSGRWEAPDA